MASSGPAPVMPPAFLVNHRRDLELLTAQVGAMRRVIWLLQKQMDDLHQEQSDFQAVGGEETDNHMVLISVQIRTVRTSLRIVRDQMNLMLIRADSLRAIIAASAGASSPRS